MSAHFRELQLRQGVIEDLSLHPPRRGLPVLYTMVIRYRYRQA